MQYDKIPIQLKCYRYFQLTSELKVSNNYSIGITSFLDYLNFL